MTNEKIIAFMKDYANRLDDDDPSDDERLLMHLETIAFMLGAIAMRLPEPNE